MIERGGEFLARLKLEKILEEAQSNFEKLTESRLRKLDKCGRILPWQPGVYVIYNDKKDILYVGSADDLHRRVSEDIFWRGHTLRHKLSIELGSKDAARDFLRKCLFRFQTIKEKNKKDAIVKADLVEALAIALLKPHYNKPYYGK